MDKLTQFIEDNFKKESIEKALNENLKWNPNMVIIEHLINALYDLPKCGTGGLCHLMIDDGNVDNDSIIFTLNECFSNRDNVESDLSIFLCNLLLQLTIEQRVALLFLIKKKKYNNKINIT